MKRYKIILALLFACLASTSYAQENNIYILPGKDRLIIYNIKGISTEGAEAKVNYVNGKITKSVTNIYGETGQSTIIYEFDTDKIKVSEKKYSYKTNIENVKSDKDMLLDYNISYPIDFKGNLIGKEMPDRIDIFKKFAEAVPFELK